MECPGNACKRNLSPPVNGRDLTKLNRTSLGVKQGDMFGFEPILSTCWLRFSVPLKPAVLWMSTASDASWHGNIQAKGGTPGKQIQAKGA